MIMRTRLLVVATVPGVSVGLLADRPLLGET